MAIKATYEYGGFAAGPVDEGDVDGVGVDETPFIGEIVDTGEFNEPLLLGLEEVDTLFAHLKLFEITD